MALQVQERLPDEGCIAFDDFLFPKAIDDAQYPIVGANVLRLTFPYAVPALIEPGGIEHLFTPTVEDPEILDIAVAYAKRFKYLIAAVTIGREGSGHKQGSLVDHPDLYAVIAFAGIFAFDMNVVIEPAGFGITADRVAYIRIAKVCGRRPGVFTSALGVEVDLLALNDSGVVAGEWTEIFYKDPLHDSI